MKRTLTILITLLNLAGAEARAWTFKNNPDFAPSLSVNFRNEELNGSHGEHLNNQPSYLRLVEDGSSTESLNTWRAGIRLPVHDSITLDFAYESIQSDRNVEVQSWGNSDHLEGHAYEFGIRCYLK